MMFLSKVWEISGYLLHHEKESAPTPEVGNKSNFSSLIRSKLFSGMLKDQDTSTKKKNAGFSSLMTGLTTKLNTNPPEKIVSFR